MPLFGKKTEVEVRVEPAEVVAGESVRAWANVGELDKKAQGARVELLYRNTYREDDRDADGDRTTRTRTSDVVVATERLAGSGQHTVELALPGDAPGTSPESVEWAARVVVDRKMARDARAETPLTVRSPLEACRFWAESHPESNNKCPMDLELSARAVKPGERLTGTLTVSPTEAISARAIRVQLLRRRFDPDNNVDSDSDTRVEVSGPVELAPGDRRTYPFDLFVPDTAPPSYKAKHNEQRWHVEGVIDVPRASDPTVKLEVVVHTA